MCKSREQGKEEGEGGGDGFLIANIGAIQILKTCRSSEKFATDPSSHHNSSWCGQNRFVVNVGHNLLTITLSIVLQDHKTTHAAGRRSVHCF